MESIFLGIGSNMGKRENNLGQAVNYIEEVIGHIVSASSIYETEPWGFSSDDQFLNQVLKVYTTLVPEALLTSILIIEEKIGRIRTQTHYASRIIDIDILLYADRVIEEPSLTIPHALLHERKFVLVPLCELVPEMVHPLFGKTFSELLDTCSDRSKVTKFSS